MITIAFIYIVMYLMLLHPRREGERYAAKGPEMIVAIIIFGALLIVPEIIGFANSAEPDRKGFVSEIPMLMIAVYIASIIARSFTIHKVKFLEAFLVMFALFACAVIMPVLLAATRVAH